MNEGTASGSAAFRALVCKALAAGRMTTVEASLSAARDRVADAWDAGWPALAQSWQAEVDWIEAQLAAKASRERAEEPA